MTSVGGAPTTARCRGSASGARRSACRRPPRPAPPPRCARFRRRQLDVERAERLGELRPRARADHRHDASGPSASTQAIASCAGVTPFSAASFCERVDQPLVALAVLAGEARQVRAEVARRRRLRAAEQAARQHAVGGDADAELGEHAGRSRLRAAADERVLDLQIADRVHRVRAADRVGARPPTGRSRGRSRPSPDRRSRRSSPRSAPPDRGAPGDRCRCDRRRAASGCRRGSSSPPPGRASMPSQLPSGPRSAPNFTDSSAWSRRSRSARPISSSLWPGAVEVAGVEQRDAASSAAWMVAMLSRSSAGPYMPGHAHAAERERKHRGAGRAELARMKLCGG